MSTRAQGAPTPDEPRDDVARYVLDEMTLDEQLAFEVRMAEDDELARTVMAAMAIDEQLARAATGERALRRRADTTARRGTAWRFAAAALAVLTIGAATWFWRTGNSAQQAQVAVVPTQLSFAQLVAELGVPADAAPAEAMRGAEATLPDGAARVDGLLRRADEQLQRALGAPAAEVRGDAFVVPLTTPDERWVAVVGVFDDGSGQIYFPADADVETARRSGLLSPGSHVLPAPRATATTEQRERGIVAFAPGFVVPRRRTEVTVLVLTMPSAPDAALWRRVRERAARAGGDLRADLRSMLPDATCSTFVVRAR